MSEAFKHAVLAHAAGDLAEAARLYGALLKEGGGPRGSVLANLSVIAVAQGDAVQAEELARQALIEAPSANAQNNLGLALKAQGRGAEARAAFEAATALDPTHAEAWSNLSGLLAVEKQHAAALEAMDKALEADPNSDATLEMALYLRADTLAWDGLDSLIARAQARIDKGAAITPYALVTICHDPAELLRAARNKAATYTRQPAPPAPASTWDGARKIRLGYFSSTLRAHATGYLLRRVMDAHDRTRFELQAFVYAEPNMTETEAQFTTALRAPFDDVVDLSALSDVQAAEAIRAKAPDILLDIDGYANGGRPGILALRPAPVQIAWLGHLCSMGAPFIDAMVADAEAIPPGDDAHYSEEIIRLPDGFFPGDGQREVSDRFQSRADLGLPETGPVLCAFNQARKITPPILDTWAAILRAVPEATLWLWRINAVAEANLTRQLAARGMKDRIVFAPSLPSPDHLCRYRFADLVLDTWPYNGHTMTSDALYMGVPVVTLRGRTFPSRVASSLIARLGLTETLVADDLQGYCARAIRLAQDASHRTSIRHSIEERAPKALFNMANFTRGLENALVLHIRKTQTPNY